MYAENPQPTLSSVHDVFMYVITMSKTNIIIKVLCVNYVAIAIYNKST